MNFIRWFIDNPIRYVVSWNLSQPESSGFDYYEIHSISRGNQISQIPSFTKKVKKYECR